jgi:hypothetical protein
MKGPWGFSGAMPVGPFLKDARLYRALTPKTTAKRLCEMFTKINKTFQKTALAA